MWEERPEQACWRSCVFFLKRKQRERRKDTVFQASLRGNPGRKPEIHTWVQMHLTQGDAGTPRLQQGLVSAPQTYLGFEEPVLLHEASQHEGVYRSRRARQEIQQPFSARSTGASMWAARTPACSQRAGSYSSTGRALLIATVWNCASFPA